VKILSRIFLSIILVFSFSCTKLETAYNFAPRLSTNFLDKYFDFSSDRYDKVKAAIEKDFKDNKALFKESLVKRLTALQELNGKKELTAEKVDEIMKDYRVLQAEVVEKFKPSLRELIINMTQEELRHIKKESEEQYEKNFETLNDKEKLIKKQMKTFERNMESIFDDVTAEQEKLFSDFVEQNYSFYKAQLEFRKSYLTKLESLFNKKEEMFDAAVKYYSGDNSVKSKEFLTKHLEFQKNLNVFFQKLWISLNDKQREEFRKTLVELKKEIEDLK
jgi:hypothetical protein